MNFESKGRNHEEMAELCGGYSLGVLDPAESARFEVHLRSGCASCTAEVEEHRATVEALASALEPVHPPAGAEERLLSMLSASPANTGEPESPRPPAFLLQYQWLWAAVVVLITLPAVWLAVDAHLNLGRSRDELVAFETTTDPITTIIDLEPTDRAGGGRARVTFDPRSGLWRLFAHEMPEPPAGMTYQGWLVTPEGPSDFGTFRPDVTGHGFLTMKLKDAPEGIGISVTLEPEGGSAVPSGPPVFEAAPASGSPSPGDLPGGGAPD